MLKIVRKYWLLAGLTFLMAVGLLLRIKGLNANYSFWTDEDHVAIFARAILARGKPALSNGYSTGNYQVLWYWLTALGMKLFGVNEFAARLPTVLFGVLTIPGVYILARELFNKKIGLVSAALTTFLVIEIIWSRQARPYQAVQLGYILCTILILWFLKGLVKGKDCFSPLLLFVVTGVITSLFHWLGLLSFIVAGLYFLIFERQLLKKIYSTGRTRWVFITAILALGVLLYKLGFTFTLEQFFLLLRQSHSHILENVKYYHSFFWRQYSLLVFLFLVGAMSGIREKKKYLFLPVVFIVFHLLFISLILNAHQVRYAYLSFPFIIIFSAAGLSFISESLASFLKGPKNGRKFVGNLLTVILTVFIIGNGYKFVFYPKQYYSLNSDMLELPEVDFKGMYSFIKEKTANIDDWVLVTTWADHATWYLGENKPDFWFRQEDAAGNLKADPLTNALILRSKEELKDIMKKHKYGIIVLESWEPFIPEGGREFVRENLKKELELDRIYPIQPRYWPVEVYSWGFN